MTIIHIKLIAAIVSVLSGYGVVRHARILMHSGTGFQDGGGWTVILLVETMFFLTAVSVSLY